VAAGTWSFGDEATARSRARCDLLRAREKSEHWHQALGLLSVRLQFCLLPNVITQSAASSALEKCQQWQQTLGLFEKMQSGLVPDANFLVLSRRESNGIRHSTSLLSQDKAVDDLEWVIAKQSSVKGVGKVR
jgi:hypothetical protein